MNINLSYNKGTINLTVPANNIAHLISPGINGSQKQFPDISQAIINETFKEFIDCIKGKNLCVLLADASRDLNPDILIKFFIPAISSCKHVRFIICTGTHNPQSRENICMLQQIRNFLTLYNLEKPDIHAHSCMDAEFRYAGTTKSGTPVEYNKLIDDADTFLVFSDIKHHYFAGYSNPVKYFMPGLCSYNTTEKNHSLALAVNSTFGRHPWHNNPSRRNNPLAADQLEGMKMMIEDRKFFAVTTVSYSGNIAFACFGRAHSAALKAFDYADRHNSYSIKPADKIIVSPGRYPNDIDLYIAQRALELTKNAVKDNGDILFISACEKGVGEKHTHENFYCPLTMPLDKILSSIKQDYKLFSHKPYKFAQLIDRTDKIWMYSELENDTVRALHLHPADNPQEVIDNWIRQDPDTSITIIDNANKTALYPAG